MQVSTERALHLHTQPGSRLMYVRHGMKMLAIFDNDGTICDTQEVEGVCYARAIEHVTGRSLSTLDCMAYDEPTSSAIVREFLAGDVAAERKEEEITREFVR